MPRYRCELHAVVYDQFPETVRDKIHLDIETDAYLVSPTVVVKLEGGETHKAALEVQELHGVPVRSKVPDYFISLICMRT